MKETFKPKRFYKGSQELLATMNGIVEDATSQGYDLSLRQLYYRLVTMNLIKNDIKVYRKMVGLVADARLCGLIDWDAITDRGRSASRAQSWDSAGDFLTDEVEYFRMNRWLGQDNYVEVMVEKDALSGVLSPVCMREDVTFTANKGYSSASAAYRAGKRFRTHYLQGRQCHLIYLGDHDPSGLHMPEELGQRLEQLGGTSIESHGHCTPIEIAVHRVALTMEQIEHYKLPHNPAKMDDPRAKSYVNQFGRVSWELDALELKVIDQLVADKVKSLRNESLFQRMKSQEAEQREWLSRNAKRANQSFKRWLKKQ